MNREPIIWENIFANDTSDKGLISKYIKNSHNYIPGRQKIQLKNGQRNLNRHFSKEDLQRAQRHMKGCSASLAIREMRIKTTIRYNFTPVRAAIMNKSRNNKCRQGCGEKVNLVHCWWECRLVQPLWKTVWNFLRKLKMELPFDLAIQLWDYTLRILKHQFKRTHAPQCS